MKLLLSLFIVLSSQVVLAQHDHHHGHKKTTDKVKSLVVKKFIPTSDLSTRMDKIQSLVIELNAKKDDAKEVKAYGGKISDVVMDIMSTCKLEPAADEAVHPILEKILEGTEDYKNNKYEAGHKKMHESLSSYKEIFSLKKK